MPWGKETVAQAQTPFYMQSLPRAAAQHHLPARAGLVLTFLMGLFSCPRAGSGAESRGLVVMAQLTGNAVALAMVRSLNNEESIFHGPQADVGSLGESEMLCRTLTAASVTAGGGKRGVGTSYGV